MRLAASLFPRYTFDLIYGRPGQSEAAWRAELASALDLAGDHISLYQLTVEPDTAFERLRNAGRLELPDEDLSLAFFLATRETDRGARPPGLRGRITPGPAARAATTSSTGATANMPGIGPGAHGRLVTPAGRLAQACERAPRRG